jgi:hypothetical protein
VTNEEFRRWVGAALHRSPSLTQWFEGMSMQSQNGINMRWFQRLAECDYNAALAAMEAIIDDPADLMRYPTDKELLAVKVADICSRQRSRESEAERVNSIVPRKKMRRTSGDGTPVGLAGELFQAIADDHRHDVECQEHRRARGRCRQGCPVPRLVAAEINARYPVDGNDRVPYKCEMCCGSGLLTVLNTACLTPEFVERGETIYRQKAAVACKCSDGQLRAAQTITGTDRKFFAQYDAKTMIREYGQPDDELRVEVVAWVKSYGGKRNADLDQFNQEMASKW